MRDRTEWDGVAVLSGYNRAMEKDVKTSLLTKLKSRKVAAAAIVTLAVAVLAVCAFVPGVGGQPGAPLGVPVDGMSKEVAAGDVPAPPVTLADVPDSDGRPSAQLNDGNPYFDAQEYAGQQLEAYSNQDAQGRCGPCVAMVGPETLPTEERGEIGEVKPTGWQIAKYDWIDGKYLYNRCHLIGYQLTGQNANTRNLITGTRFMNVQGMEPYEDQVAEYVQRTGNHVLYRVTPLFEGDDMLAHGVVMEAQSVEDGGAGVCFCVFCYNQQPGVTIDYATGDNASDGTMEQIWEDWNAYDEAASTESGLTAGASGSEEADAPEEYDYVLNTNSHKFHVPSCSSVDDMSERNKYYFDGTREEAIDMGYDPCKRCNP